MPDAQRLRLLCVMQLPPPVHGASVVNASVASSEKLGREFEISVLPMRFAESIADIGRVSSKKLTRTAATAARLMWRLARRRPDGVYFTLSPVGGAFYRDMLLVGVVKAFGVPRVFHLHGKGIAAQLETPWKRRLYAWVLDGASVIHLSPRVAETRPLVPEDRIYFVPNGVPDRDAVTQTPRSGPPRILFLSNLVPEKGPLVLLEALGRLRASNVAFEATFAGAPGNVAGLRAFEALVARYDLAAHVRYIGPVFGRDKEALFRDHDVFAFPTYYAQEAFPLVVLEAMQRGLPVVATPEGAIADMVEDGRTGYLVPQRNAEALADRLRKLLCDPELRSRFGERARALYLERFTFDRFEDQLCDVLSRALARQDR